MKVKNVVKDFLTKGYWARLKHLEKMGRVPQPILDGARRNYENPLSDVTKKSLEEFGNVEVHGFQYQKGYGGKTYVRMSLGINSGPDILLVPSKFDSTKWYIYQQKENN